MDMVARQELTLEEVAAAATTIQNDGEQVTLEAVLEALGTGSPAVVYRHLVTWRDNLAKPVEPPKADLPEPLMAALTDWAKQFAEQSSAGVREALALAQSDLQTLVGSGEELQTERDNLLVEVENATTARDDALELINQRNEEIERLTAELRDARKIATDALVNKAKDQLAIDGKDAQLADLRAQIERSVAAQASESDARLAAQMELVGVTTERDNLVAEIKQLRTQLDAINAERGVFRARTS